MMAENGSNVNGKKNKLTLQGAAFLASVILPFIIYAGLQNGQPVLAAAAFGALALTMLLILWIA
jgi:hypothetical protein